MDASVGCGRTLAAEGPIYLAVIPVGHAGGYSRALIRGRSAPVVDRVCMNILRADVTAIPGVSIGDEFLASPHFSPGFVARVAKRKYPLGLLRIGRRSRSSATSRSTI